MLIEETPQVSVIIPARDRPELLLRAINSALKQKGVCVEVIVVDDGSVPALSTVLEALTLSRIKLLRNERPMNAAYSRNRGANEAVAKVYAFLDSDDVWASDHIKLALAALDEHGRSCLYVAPGGAGKVRASHEVAYFIKDVYSFKFTQGGDLRSSCMVCPKEVFENVGGFDSKLFKHQDWDFALRSGSLSPFLRGGKPSVYLDSTAKGRMSYKPNLHASRYFLEKHSAQMSSKQITRFLAGVVKSCAMVGDKSQMSACKRLLSDYSSKESLPFKERALLCLPILGRSFLLLRNLFRRT